LAPASSRAVKQKHDQFLTTHLSFFYHILRLEVAFTHFSHPRSLFYRSFRYIYIHSICRHMTNAQDPGQGGPTPGPSSANGVPSMSASSSTSPRGVDPARFAHLPLNLGGGSSAASSSRGPSNNTSNLQQLASPPASQTARPNSSNTGTHATRPSGQLGQRPNAARPPSPEHQPSTSQIPAATGQPDIQRVHLNRIAELEAEVLMLRGMQQPALTPPEPAQAGAAPLGRNPSIVRLFEDDDTIARLKEAFKPRDEGKKVSLPDIQPGFKASALDVGEHHSLSVRSPDKWLRAKGQ